jgi:glycine cleavage system aminomethyltransferase T
LAGSSVIVSRTGHTGAAQGYELFVPFGAAQRFWGEALSRGAEHGIRPTGWNAWRTAGIAAGLPWLGHEIAGALHVTPVQAGYGGVVRIHKPFFVGRGPLVKNAYPPTREIVRFQLLDPSLPIQAGDSLVETSGRCVGIVTSAPLVEGEAIGLAYSETSPAAVGARLEVIHGPAPVSDESIGVPAPIDVGGGRRATVEVVLRFPK